MPACKPIEQMIAETDTTAIIEALKDGFRPMPYDPYKYQVVAHNETAKAIGNYSEKGAFIVKAAVSAGKTTLISLFVRRVMQMRQRAPNITALVLSRQGGIIEQDGAEIRNFGVENSIFCAGLRMKSTTFPIICGSEKSVYNALEGPLAEFAPRFILIDECQHVNVDDIVESQMTCDTWKDDPENERLEHRAENSLDKMKAVGRTAYTCIIRELQFRCKKRWGKELVIVGYTGTDYRGTQPIIQEDLSLPGFWRRAVVDISTEFLVKEGAVVPTNFGLIDADMSYDLSAYHSRGSEGDDEFSEADLKQMESDIMAQGTKTQVIMLDVMKRTANRNCVLVTCAGKKHCKEAAAALPPGVTYGIVTDDTPETKRNKILKDAFNNECKYIFQVGCLTTGYNVPPWDTIVILRKIGSLTLLTQLIGRGMRILKKYHVEVLGMVKEDNLVLDYAGTMDDLADLYANPMLEQYIYSKDKASNKFQTCPECGKENGAHARRCSQIFDDSTPDLIERRAILGYSLGDRCEHFFVSRPCVDFRNDRGVIVSEGCGADNDIVARFCRKCGNQLIDPNKNLDGKAYTDGDFVAVRSFNLEPTKCGGGVVFRYVLGNGEEPDFTAYEIFWPDSESVAAKHQWRTAIDKHITSPKNRAMVRRGVNKILSQAHLFAKPLRVSHRRIGTNKKRDVITRKVFNDIEDL